jgi:hypothetical protein
MKAVDGALEKGVIKADYAQVLKKNLREGEHDGMKDEDFQGCLRGNSALSDAEGGGGGGRGGGGGGGSSEMGLCAMAVVGKSRSGANLTRPSNNPTNPPLNPSITNTNDPSNAPHKPTNPQR